MAKSKKPVKKTTAPKRAVVSSKTRRKPVKAKKAVKVTRKPVKAKKAVKVTRKPVKAKKAVKVTKRAIKAKKIKVVNPKTGRKKTVKPVTEIEQLNLTTPQTEKFVNLKPFSFSDLNTGVVDKIFFFNSEFETTPTVTWGGQTVPVTNEQLLELVNRLTTSYHDYAEKKKIPSPIIRWKSTIDPAKGTANLNLDESFFAGDEDEPFDPSDIFFDMF